jgi:oligoendopeptidase F
MTATATGAERDRANVAESYKWNLADLYPSLEAWREDKTRVVRQLPGVRTFQGRLASSPAVLADALELLTELDRILTKLHVYASLLSDEDSRLARPQGMQQEMQQLHARLAAEAAYVEPEILKIAPADLEEAIAEEPRLAPYTFHLRDILRRAPHTLSDAEERILAGAAPVAGASSNIYTILANADFPYPTIALADGRRVTVDQAGYAELRTSPVRSDREKAMSAFFGALGAFSRTLGATMHANVQKSLFYARARGYGSNLEASLSGANIPVAVYAGLIDGVNRHLPALHRYLRLRKQAMGLEDDLHYFDLYAPLVASVDLRYTPEEAQARVVSATAPLGAEYADVLGRAFHNRWIDWYPTTGKVSGAYSNGAAYDTHPYVLLNYLGQYNDVSTLAHELGHTMHSYYSNRIQPYPTASYQTFVAEVASTFNEALLMDFMLKQIEDRPTRLSLLGSYLEGVKATVFRQTQFAEFELRMHETAQRDEPITGEGLADLYLTIARRYYGHDERVLVVDDYVAHEWSYIPHFYRDFYVFQYATSFMAAEALSSRVLAGDEAATGRYLGFLSAGGSKYPIDLLRDAGVDMTTAEPLDLTMKRMNQAMDEVERLLL